MELTPLDPRARLLFHLQALVRLAFFWLPASAGMGVGLGAFVSIPLGVIVGLLVFFLAFLLAIWFPSFEFERWGYAIREGDLLVAHGVLVRRITAIPLDRIQHVDTRQGLIEQWIGVARVQVHTASGVGADGVIPGLSEEDAVRVRDELVRLRGGDDGV